MKKKNFRDVLGTNSGPHLMRSEFLNRDFSNCDMFDLGLEYCKFIFCDLSESNMNYTDLSEASFTGCNLSGVSFSESKSNNVCFDQCIGNRGDGTVSYSTRWKSVTVGNCSFNDIVFRYAEFGKLKVVSSYMKNSWFGDCTMRDSFFFETDLTGTSFAESDLCGSVFRDCNLLGANFTECKLANVKFINCQLDNPVRLFFRVRRDSITVPISNALRKARNFVGYVIENLAYAVQKIAHDHISTKNR